MGYVIGVFVWIYATIFKLIGKGCKAGFNASKKLLVNKGMKPMLATVLSVVIVAVVLCIVIGIL